MLYKRFFFLLIPLLLTLTACSKPDKAVSKSVSAEVKLTASQTAAALAPIELAGINLRTAKKQELEEAFLKTHNMRFIPRNNWESVADSAGNAIQGADKLELATTKGGAFVFLQFIFHDGANAGQRVKVQQQLEAKYGKPAGVDGRADRGEYRAVWDMGGDFLIQLSSGGSEKAAFLIFVARENLLQMKSEYQEMVNLRAKQKTAGQ